MPVFFNILKMELGLCPAASPKLMIRATKNEYQINNNYLDENSCLNG